MNAPKNALSAVLAAAPLVAFLAGCGPSDHDLAVASVTSAIQTSRSPNMGKVLLGDLDPNACLDPAAAAAEAASRPAVGLYPSTCATKTAEGASVHAELSGCTGAFGVRIDGGLDATLTAPSCDVIHGEIVDSGDLTGNAIPVDYSASADVRIREDGARLVAWAAHWTATTPRGVHLENTSDLDVVIDDATSCHTIDGTSKGKVGGWDVDASYAGVVVCPDACPSAGKVEVDASNGAHDRSITLVFDGSDVAKVTGTDGREFTVQMACADGESAD